MIENRELTKRVLPELFANYSVLPVDDYPSQLYSMLKSLSPANRAKPCVVVLTPGVFNSAYFEHAFLARAMGAMSFATSFEVRKGCLLRPHESLGSSFAFSTLFLGSFTFAFWFTFALTFSLFALAFAGPAHILSDAVLAGPRHLEGSLSGLGAAADLPRAGLAVRAHGRGRQHPLHVHAARQVSKRAVPRHRRRGAGLDRHARYGEELPDGRRQLVANARRPPPWSL